LVEDRVPPDELTGLEEHLRSCTSCQSVLDQSADSDRWLGAVRHYLGGNSAAAAGKAPNLAAMRLDFLGASDWPDSLGRVGTYEIKKVLGRGGMGVVLKAFDSALNRNVAIKVLSTHLATSGAARQRFLREARAAAAVVHEHVVAVHAVDEAAGLPYLVMEYVPGRSLQDRLDEQGPLSLVEILRVGMQAASGLAAAHAQGLVHRDVKPANILLENGVERARLTDFGLARAAADAGLTQTGTVIGTPHYMAPEQARGEPVDHRADLFSLGSTLYAMCTGYPPFRAESPLAVVRRVSDDEPRPIQEVNADMPVWLSGIIARLQAKDPSKRYQTAAKVSELLGQCLAHIQQPLAVPMPSDVCISTAKPARRWSRWAALGTLAFLAAALVLVPIRQSGSKDVDHDPSNKSAPTVHSGADEIDDQIARLWSGLGVIEADVRRPDDQRKLDSMSAAIFELSRCASSLERDIASASSPSHAPSNASVPNPYRGDDR
jgi:serine/threonine-protein kinase